MEIAEKIFHFNDKGALDDQSSGTSEVIYSHFWDSLQENTLAQEFLPKEVFHVQDNYHRISFHPAYGAAILCKTLDSLEVFVRTVGLDKWEFRIHSSSDGRERFAVPMLDDPAIMVHGPFPTHLIDKLEESLVQALQKSETYRGAKRRKTGDHEGNQKTPSFLNEKLGQSIKIVASDPKKQITGDFFTNASGYGGTTDVGMHTGGKKRNTAAPLVFSVISTILQLAGRVDNEFKSLVAIYFTGFLDEFPEVTTYDARANDRYIIVMREARPFTEELENETLKQEILQKQRMHHSRLYSMPYGPPKELELCKVSELLGDLSAPEFPKGPPRPQISGSESKLEMSRREAEQNLMWIDMDSKTFSGRKQEAWVQLHALNIRFWKSASILNEESISECVVVLQEDLERLSRIVKVAFGAANEGRYTMSVVIKSYELLAAAICFCFAHRKVEQNHEWFKNYGPAFDPNNLDHLVLDDKRAIDAAGQVRAFLEMRAKGTVPLRNHEDTMSLARRFASEHSKRATQNRQVHQAFLTESRRQIQNRWQDIENRQSQLRALDDELIGAQEDLSNAKSSLSRVERESEYYLDSSSRIHSAMATVNEARRNVSRLEQRIKSLERKPENLVFSLPEEENGAAVLLFFVFMEDDFRNLAELAHQAESLLWGEEDIPKTNKKGQPLPSWLCVSRGLSKNGISQGMIRLFCPSNITHPTTGIRGYGPRTGVFFPKVEKDFSIGWEGTSPFDDLCRDSARVFTETFDPQWIGHEPDRNTKFTMDVFLVAHPSSVRENIAPAKPEMKTNWLTREQYNAFASLRVTGRTQVRCLLNALYDKLLPLGNPCVHILIQQVVFQIGATDWKTDLEPNWNGLQAIEGFCRYEVDEIRHAQKCFERLLLAGVVSGYFGQFIKGIEKVAIEASAIFDLWANEILLEDRNLDLIAKQARFYGYALLCLATVELNFQRRSALLRLLVLYRDRLLLSQEKGDRVLEQGVMKVMGTKWPCSSDRDSMAVTHELLTPLVQTVVESAPSDLMWSEVRYNGGGSTACFEAVGDGRLFSINLNNGVVLVNGKPKSFLPQSITSDILFVKHFGSASPEVSIEGIHHYRTTHKVQDFFFYDFVIDAAGQLHIFEFDSRKGFNDYDRLELLDPDNMPFQPHLAKQHSHWINEKQQYLLLRDKSIQSHRISFAMRPGKLLSVPPAFCCASIEEIFQKQDQCDAMLVGSTPFIKLLSDTGFEEAQYVIVSTDQNGAIKYSLPRYGLSFTQTDEGIQSEDFKGYYVTPNQQLEDTLPGFKSFLLLSNSDGENMVVVPCGEVLDQGGIKMLQGWDRAINFHAFRVHRRFRHLESSTTLGRLHLACLYASTGCLVPDRRTGKTGMTIAVELLRQCFQNFRFSKEELAKLRNLSKHSGLSSTLRLLVWCIYRWSRSLLLPYQRTLEEEELLNLDKLACEEYHNSPTGPYLTSAEEQTVFCRTSAMKESIEEDNDTAISCKESKIADYIRKIETERFQSLLKKEQRNCTSEFPLAVAHMAHKGEGGGTIRERVQADLQESYRTYSELLIKKVDFCDVDVAEISREVRHLRESIEKRILDTLSEALSTKQAFDFFAGSMGKFVSSDLIHLIYDVSFVRRLQPLENGSRWIFDIMSQGHDWGLLCVLEDKIYRLQRFSEQQKDVELIQELQCTRIWNPREHPRWLAFEVEQQLQIRPEQFKTVDQLLQNPTGSVIQLNMGSGKTRVMVPMLVLELCRQKRKLVRINVLSSILQEAILFYQKSLVASVQHTKLYTLPFVRDNDLDGIKVKILDEEVRRCHTFGGCIIMTPQHRNSLLLKQHDTDVYLSELPEELSFDVIDESDAILEPNFQLVYAMGKKQDLPSRSTRCTMLQSLLRILSRGECTTSLYLLEDPHTFYKEDCESGFFSNLRVLKLSSGDKNILTRSVAEHFVRNPLPGFEWLEKVKKQQDIELLVTMISQPEFQDTTSVVSRFPLFSLFEHDILAARGFLAYGILLHCLEARWGVSYGLRHLRDDDTQMAVPYSASDTPKPRAEFSHPDVAIVYTNLSYLHLGLTKSQFQMALDLLDAKDETVKSFTYAVWIENVRADVPTVELDQFDKYEKVDPSNQTQFEIMYRRLNRCMEVVFFWLNEVVFPVDTMQYPQRRISSAWNLVDSKYIIGFSGTDDNRFLLPYQVEQIRHTDEELRATNGKMIDLVLSCSKSIYQITTDQPAIWKTVLDSCFHLKVQALIDTGGLMAGCKLDSVVRYVATRLKGDEESVFEGFLYYSTNKERWEVFEFATGRTHSIARSTLSACDCFVFFDESRCRGTDLKLRRDSQALVTLDKRLTKDKFLQGCARMRQLFPGGQSLILAGTADIVPEGSTVLSLLKMIVERGIETVERGLRTYMQRAEDFVSFPKPVDDIFELKAMYSERLVQNESFLEYLDRVEELHCSESRLFNEVKDYAKSIGDSVGVDGGIGVEECEKEVHVESEQDEQREVEITKQEPRSQVDWDYKMVFSEPGRLFGSQFYGLSDLIEKYGIAGMIGIRWSKKVYCTLNFWRTIKDAHAARAQSPFLRLVDPFIVLPDNRVVLISLHELDNLLPLWWAQSSRPPVSINHVFEHTSDCPQLGRWSLPVSSETLTSIKLFRGDVLYNSDEKSILREMLRDLHRPIETMKQLLSSRNRLGRYEKSDLAAEAYLISLPS